MKSSNKKLIIYFMPLIFSLTFNNNSFADIKTENKSTSKLEKIKSFGSKALNAINNHKIEIIKAAIIISACLCIKHLYSRLGTATGTIASNKTQIEQLTRERDEAKKQLGIVQGALKTAEDELKLKNLIAQTSSKELMDRLAGLGVETDLADSIFSSIISKLSDLISTNNRLQQENEQLKSQEKQIEITNDFFDCEELPKQLTSLGIDGTEIYEKLKSSLALNFGFWVNKHIQDVNEILQAATDSCVKEHCKNIIKADWLHSKSVITNTPNNACIIRFIANCAIIKINFPKDVNLDQLDLNLVKGCPCKKKDDFNSICSRLKRMLEQQ